MTQISEQILDLARWAPSGDNEQPWRFEIKSDLEFVIHGRDTRDHCVYDLDGRSSVMAIGALIETICIAATAHGLRTEVDQRPELPEEKPTFDIRLVRAAGSEPSPLLPAITLRAVQRRPLSTAPLAFAQKSDLEASVSPDFRVIWFESLRERLRVTRLLFHNAKLRLTMPEGYETHHRVIEWGAQYSEDRIPDRALGLDAFTVKLMRPIMESWERVEFFNTWLGGT